MSDEWSTKQNVNQKLVKNVSKKNLNVSKRLKLKSV